MIFPDEEMQNTDLERLSQHLIKHAVPNRASHGNANHKMVFAMQMPLMLFSYSVAAFLAGLFAVVFGTLRPVWSDDAKVRSDNLNSVE